jgi:hypothetical protein
MALIAQGYASRGMEATESSIKTNCSAGMMLQIPGSADDPVVQTSEELMDPGVTVQEIENMGR